MFDLHPDLRRYVSVAFFLSAGVALFGVLFFILGVTGIYTPEGKRYWPFIIFGVVAILSGYVGMAIVPRHYRAASRIFSSATSTPERIILELESDSDHTCLYATSIDSTAATRPDRIGLLLPAWSYEPLLGKPLDVSVYRDPITNRPVAFLTSNGLLWCLLPWQALV